MKFSTGVPTQYPFEYILEHNEDAENDCPVMALGVTGVGEQGEGGATAHAQKARSGCD